MTDLAERFKEVRQQVLRPQPKVKLSDWMEQNFHLSRINSAEPGLIKLSRTPYLREIMDTMTDYEHEKVCVMAAAQTGKSTCLNGSLAYYIAEDPSAILFLQPTVSLAKSYSRERISPMIEDCPALKEIIPAPMSRKTGQTLQTKMFPGGVLNLVGSNSPSELASRPCRIILLDEISKYPESAGTMGSPIQLALARSATYFNRKALMTSTPGVKGSCQMENEYNLSDMRDYYTPCKTCEEPFIPRWSHVKWDSDEEHNHDPMSARLECPNCGECHTDSDRIKMVRAGHWQAKYPERIVAGFHLTQLVSPWVKLHEMVTRWLSAQGKVMKLKTFINEVLAETFDAEMYMAEGIDDLNFAARAEQYTPESIPKGVHFLTAGVDLQSDRIECTIAGFGKNDEIWVISHEIFHGSPGLIPVWQELSDHLQTVFRREDDVPMRVTTACIDSGYQTNAVYQFCSNNKARKWLAVKGGSEYGKPLFPKRATATGSKKQFKLYVLGVDSGKFTIYEWLQNETPGDSYIHFPDSLDLEYYDQLTAEKVIPKFSRGIRQMVFKLQKGRRNETLDTLNYALAGRYSLNPNWDRIEAANKSRIGKYKTEVKNTKVTKQSDFSNDEGGNTVNTPDTEPDYQQKLLKEHMKRNRAARRGGGGFVKRY